MFLVILGYYEVLNTENRTRLTKQQSKIFLAFCYYVPLQQNVVIKELSNCKNSFSDKGDELFCHQ